ncbi:DNA-processing protein DprA [Halomonas pacifica]|uniref:DNA-protecting protein DprA n=1 Tax=Bisbaumannia pacifica TaxID=77098 RepID=A0ABD4L0H3_9GAMM|nr:DNA-processing protein DprA [Halomonas pacifica]MBH8579127.1 DNA-protecting protein DprA [Halomonas pacifica]MDC8802118.1 DNA-processing protein DprA [Halomonas pacifica]
MTAREWWLLTRLPGLGALQLARLRAQSPAWPEGWLALLPGQARQALRLWLEHPARSSLQAELEALEEWVGAAEDHHLLSPDHPAWPRLLDELPDPPPLLWARGELATLTPPRLAMVGSRRPTRDGLRSAARFAEAMAAQGWCVVSGMALGIDGGAQAAALAAGGTSLAVLGTGIDVIYPRQHGALYERLRRDGLLLSEHPPGTPPHPGHFPRRNRIITGLSRGVLVVEAAERSGSLVSARLALEQGRDLFVLPGSLHNPQARGCLQLLRQGATLITRPEELLEELGHWEGPLAVSMPEPEPAAADDTPLLALLSDVPTPLDALVALAGLSVAECQRQLLALELEGRVTATAGGWIRLP